MGTDITGHRSDGNLTDFWRDLPKRQISLLLTAPIHRMETNKTRYEGYKDHDIRAYALRTLEAVINAMALEQGATEDEIISDLARFIREVSKNEPSEARKIAEWVVAELVNDDERRLPFKEAYLSRNEDGIRRRAFSFRLLDQIYDPNDPNNHPFRATPEALHLYIGVLLLEIEDEQRARESLMEYHLKHNNLESTRLNADASLKATLAYEQKLKTAIDIASRDINQIAWARDIIPQLNDARNHIGERQESMGHIRERLRAKASELKAESVHTLESVSALVDACLSRNRKLLSVIIGANDRYRDAAESQGLRSHLIGISRSLILEIAQPLLKTQLRHWGPNEQIALTGYLAGTMDRRVFDFNGFIERMLQSPREEEALPDLAVDEKTRLEIVSGLFSDEDINYVDEFLLTYEGTIGSALILWESENASMEKRELLILKALQEFGNSTNEISRASKTGKMIETATYKMDDLKWKTN